MKIAPAAVAQRPAAAMSRLLVVVCTSDSFVGAGRGVRRCRQRRNRCGEHTSHDDVIEGGDPDLDEAQSRLSSVARRTAARRVLTSSFWKMCLVWVRSVFNEMYSCPAISGPLSSVA